VRNSERAFATCCCRAAGARQVVARMVQPVRQARRRSESASIAPFISRSCKRWWGIDSCVACVRLLTQQPAPWMVSLEPRQVGGIFSQAVVGTALSCSTRHAQPSNGAEHVTKKGIATRVSCSRLVQCRTQLCGANTTTYQRSARWVCAPCIFKQVDTVFRAALSPRCAITVHPIQTFKHRPCCTEHSCRSGTAQAFSAAQTHMLSFAFHRPALRPWWVPARMFVWAQLHSCWRRVVNASRPCLARDRTCTYIVH
jgi:hypothetical protein